MKYFSNKEKMKYNEIKWNFIETELIQILA